MSFTIVKSIICVNPDFNEKYFCLKCHPNPLIYFSVSDKKHRYILCTYFNIYIIITEFINMYNVPTDHIYGRIHGLINKTY